LIRGYSQNEVLKPLTKQQWFSHSRI